MNIMSKITFKTLGLNKMRTFATILGIVLSVALFTAVTSSVTSFTGYLRDTVIKKNGHYHFSSYKGAQELNNLKGLKSATYMDHIGYAPIEESKATNPYKKHIFITSVPEDFARMVDLKIIEGRKPEKPGEILISKHMLEANTQLGYKIGSVLDLEIGARTLGKKVLGQLFGYSSGTNHAEKFTSVLKRSFTVVGICERPGFESYRAGGYTAFINEDEGTEIADAYPALRDFGALSKKDGGEDAHSSPSGSSTKGSSTSGGKSSSGNVKKRTHMYLMKSGAAARKYIDANKGDILTENSLLLMLDGDFNKNTVGRTLTIFAAVLSVVVFIASVSLIYNEFSISVAERTKDFGLLASIGASKRQIRKSVFTEALFLSIIGIPIGILVGITGIGITLKALQLDFQNTFFTDVVSGDFGVRVSTLGIALSAGLGLITVLVSAMIPAVRGSKVDPIAAIRGLSDIKVSEKDVKTGWFTRKFFGLPAQIATKHYRRSRRAYRTTVFSLFLSVVLFVTLTFLTRNIETATYMSIGDNIVDIRVRTDDIHRHHQKAYKNDGGEIVKGSVKTKYPGTDKNENRLLQDVPEYVLKRVRSVPEVDQMVYVKQMEYPWNIFGENGNEVMVNVMFLQPAEYQKLLKANKIEYADQSGRDLPEPVFSDLSMYFSTAEQKTHKRHMVTDGSRQLLIERKKPIPLGARIEKRPFYIPTDGKVYLIYEDMHFQKVYKYINDKRYITGLESTELLIKADKEAAAEIAVEKILKDANVPVYLLVNLRRNAKAILSFVRIVKLFVYGFIVLISLIAATNVFSTITTNVLLRKREFAVLRSVGLAPRGFSEMMLFESLLFGTRSLMYALPVSAGLGLLVSMGAKQTIEISRTIPWLEMGTASIGVLLLVIITMFYSMAKIKKLNTIDAVRSIH